MQLKLFIVLTRVLACCASPLPNDATEPDLLGVDFTENMADMSCSSWLPPCEGFRSKKSALFPVRTDSLRRSYLALNDSVRSLA